MPDRRAISMRLAEDVVENLEQEAEDRDQSRSEYLRDIVHRRNENYEQVQELQQTVTDLRRQLDEERVANEEWRAVIEQQANQIEQLQLIQSETLRSDMRELDQLRQTVVSELRGEVDRLEGQRNWMEEAIDNDLYNGMRDLEAAITRFEEDDKVSRLEEIQDVIEQNQRTLHQQINQQREADYRIDLFTDFDRTVLISVGLMIFGWLFFGTILPAVLATLWPF